MQKKHINKISHSNTQWQNKTDNVIDVTGWGGGGERSEKHFKGTES